MTQPCPPAPNYARQFGVADCQYTQLTPYQKQRMHRAHMESLQHSETTRNPNGYYKIGGYNMQPSHIFGISGIDHGCNCPTMGSMQLFGMPRTNPHCRVHGIARSNPVFGLGRSVLSMSAAQKYNGGSKSVKPSSVGDYGSTTSQSFINDLWTAQVLAYWVTNGGAFQEAINEDQVGLVTKQGHNPNDPSPLRINSNGIATTNLKSILNPKGNNSDVFVLGPDGMFGPAAESIIEEWAGTGKLFGKSLSGNSAKALNRLAQNVKTSKIDAARAKKAQGQTVASRTQAAKTPCNQLSSTAQAARKDCVTSGGGGSSKTRDSSRTKSSVAGDKSPKEESDNTVMIAAAAGVGLLLIGAGVVIYKKKKANRV